MNNTQMVQWLIQQDFTYEQIASACGVTREHIRQIAIGMRAGGRKAEAKLSPLVALVLDGGDASRAIKIYCPEPEEVPEEMAKAVRQYFQDLWGGRCPVCHQAVTRQEQIGRSVYGVPCGHRMFQGEAGAFQKSPGGEKDGTS